MDNKYKNIVLGILVIVVATALVVSLKRGRANAQPAGGYASLTLEETAYDFGNLSMAAGKVMHGFKIKNTSDKPVVINKFYTSCMCTEATLEVGGKKIGPYGMPGHTSIPTIGERLAPGAEATIDVDFDPAAHGPAGVGHIERVIYIESKGVPKQELGISATVTP